MADNPFSTAPSGSGGLRGVSRQIAALMVGKSAFSNKGGITARDTAALNEQTHTQNVQRDVMKHTLAETAADSASKRTAKQNKQAHKLGQSAAEAGHQREVSATTHLIDHFERMGSSGQFSNLNVGKSGVSGTYKAQPKTNSVNLDD